MAKVSPERRDIQQPEVQFNAGVNEATFSKLGASVNFINERQNNVFDFKFLGPFRPLSGGEDGARGFIFDCDIVGISGYIRGTGTSGSTILDMHWLNTSGDQGTVFSTKLTIANTAADNSIFYKNLIDATSYAGSGITLPVFSKTEFDQGNTIRVDVDSNAVAAHDITLNIHYRPR